MSRKIFVGNLPHNIDQQTLKLAFSSCGTVDTVKLITDKFTGHTKGIAFIEMSTKSEAQKAIQTLNGTKIDHWEIKVSEAKPNKTLNRSRKQPRYYNG